MSFVKNFGLKLVVALFSFSIFGLAIVFSVSSVFGTPDNLKTSLQKSEIYKVLPNEIAKQLVSETTANQNMPIDNKFIEPAVTSAITPSFVQINTEKIIDGTYSWLDGTTPTPIVRIDISDVQKQISANLSDQAVKRISKLPVCTQAQLRQLSQSNVNPFTIPCQPPEFDTASVSKQFEQEAQSNNGLLQEKTITGANIKNSSGQNVFAQAERVPQAFQLGQKLPWIFGILIIICGTVVILLNNPKQRGVRSLSRSLLVAGTLLLVFMTIVNVVLRQSEYHTMNQNEELGGVVLSIAHKLIDQVNSPLRIFAAIYVFIGVAGIVIPKYILPHIKLSKRLQKNLPHQGL